MCASHGQEICYLSVHIVKKNAQYQLKKNIIKVFLTEFAFIRIVSKSYLECCLSYWFSGTSCLRVVHLPHPPQQLHPLPSAKLLPVRLSSSRIIFFALVTVLETM